jgi:hypothetical protein
MLRGEAPQRKEGQKRGGGGIAARNSGTGGMMFGPPVAATLTYPAILAPVPRFCPRGRIARAGPARYHWDRRQDGNFDHAANSQAAPPSVRQGRR